MKPGSKFKIVPSTNDEGDETHSTRHAEIKAQLVNDIRSGKYPVDKLLPTELALCEMFDVSRFTVRQALQSLLDMGMIERRRGVGTIVIASRPRECFVQSLSSMTELLRYPSETYRRDFFRQKLKVNAEQAHMLSCSPGDEWVRVKGIRLSRGSKWPISASDIFVLPRFESVFDLPNPRGEPVYSQIESHFDHPIMNARVEIFAGQITDELSKPLELEVGTPALNMIRRYTGSDGKVFLVTYTVHPANRFAFTLELQRHWEPV
ncbi:GntR family transcriptional regulator [Ancylobacter sonchi]|uniref:GntR family transcriptional regulator n=1 Tax=Ancylobacter sonchi TaxID=1937790 RepID=UPI001BD4FC0C|nr:GntR family transcriptional regulator [Ancylobacter sonchi]MBS7532486.1 GntR family transcriptional regulator [Ancylobacter sonchi]